MLLNEIGCPACDRSDLKVQSTYSVQSGEQRRLYGCVHCRCYFSETYGSALAGLRTALSRIQQILAALNDGMRVNAVCRSLPVSKHTLTAWHERLRAVTDAWRLYALCHQCLQQLIAGDERYTPVNVHQPPADSPRWSIGLMDRASRFIWELSGGERERALCAQTMRTLGSEKE